MPTRLVLALLKRALLGLDEERYLALITGVEAARFAGERWRNGNQS